MMGLTFMTSRRSLTLVGNTLVVFAGVITFVLAFLHSHDPIPLPIGGNVGVALSIAIWAAASLAAIGILMLCAIWLAAPYNDRELRPDAPPFSNLNGDDAEKHRMQGRLMGLMEVASAVIFLVLGPSIVTGVASYMFAVDGLFVLYLSTYFLPAQHRAVTTFHNTFDGLSRLIVLPVAWPWLLILLWLEPWPEGHFPDAPNGCESE